MTNAPQSIDKLSGTHWTRCGNIDQYKHFSITEVNKRSGTVTLTPVLDGSDIVLAWRDLRDRESWTPGWKR